MFPFRPCTDLHEGKVKQIVGATLRDGETPGTNYSTDRPGSWFAALYRHPQVMRTTDVARRVVGELFAAYLAAPAEMPADFAALPDRHRAVADYVAGMTDRFAAREHRRLTGEDLFGALEHLPELGWPAVPGVDPDAAPAA